jgi:N-dimethylarginine dimethylaminohydrolase
MQPLTSDSLTIKASDYSPQAIGKLIYMMDPNSFEIVDAINPHMKAADGSLNTINKERALKQWHDLKSVYESLGFRIEVLASEPNCPDMVFCANQTFPFLDNGIEPHVILCNMASDSRQFEVEPIARQLKKLGVLTNELPPRTPDSLFEGMGDALWVPGRRLILGGYGSRTNKAIYTKLSEIVCAPIVLFELVHPRFYHLDTCLSILDERTVLAAREGFHPRDWVLLHELFENVIEVELKEADFPGFACNAHCPDRKHVIIQRGNEKTNAALRALDYVPVEVDTDEYIKSGGSVFCMKLHTLWD